MHSGGSTADISLPEFNWHKIGEEEGFITVYPTASSDNSWNSMLFDYRKSEFEFLTMLIEHMKTSYPVDISRIYISGFSNGSGMAHVLAACRPDLIAGAIVFNTRFPIHGGVYKAAMAIKEKYDFRIPIFASYGTKDAEYPPQEGSGQFSQMRFWKWFNNIEQKELNGNDKSGVGVPGDNVAIWGPAEKEGKTLYTTHKYYSRDKGPVNYYNYTLIKGLPHSIEQGIIPEAWLFVSQFSRNDDGSLKVKKNSYRE